MPRTARPWPARPAARAQEHRTVSSTGRPCMRGRSDGQHLGRPGRAGSGTMSTEWVPLSISTPPPLTRRVGVPAPAHVHRRGEGVLQRDDVAEGARGDERAGAQRRRRRSGTSRPSSAGRRSARRSATSASACVAAERQRLLAEHRRRPPRAAWSPAAAWVDGGRGDHDQVEALGVGELGRRPPAPGASSCSASAPGRRPAAGPRPRRRRPPSTACAASACVSAMAPAPRMPSRTGRLTPAPGRRAGRPARPRRGSRRRGRRRRRCSRSFQGSTSTVSRKAKVPGKRSARSRAPRAGRA